LAFDIPSLCPVSREPPELLLDVRLVAASVAATRRRAILKPDVLVDRHL
jgi:hypothetical protein